MANDSINDHEFNPKSGDGKRLINFLLLNLPSADKSKDYLGGMHTPDILRIFKLNGRGEPALKFMLEGNTQKPSRLVAIMYKVGGLRFFFKNDESFPTSAELKRDHNVIAVLGFSVQDIQFAQELESDAFKHFSKLLQKKVKVCKADILTYFKLDWPFDNFSRGHAVRRVFEKLTEAFPAGQIVDDCIEIGQEMPIGDVEAAAEYDPEAAQVMEIVRTANPAIAQAMQEVSQMFEPEPESGMSFMRMDDARKIEVYLTAQHEGGHDFLVLTYYLDTKAWTLAWDQLPEMGGVLTAQTYVIIHRQNGQWIKIQSSAGFTLK